ncbi:MAG: hypothetical protein M3082_15255 [Candidatus Dormibacteraeota bacterium]|nr:hypothetical protein [Candidatus Dormibacteraeota bacterium]
MTPKSHRVAALEVPARRQLLGWVNHRSAGAYKVARDFKLGGQPALTVVSNGGARQIFATTGDGAR